MIFKIKQNDLREAIEISAKAIPIRSTNPAMECFKIKNKNNKIFIVSYDGQNAISAPVKGNIEEDGAFLVNAKTLSGIVSKLSNDIEFKTKGNKLTISSGESKYTLSIMKEENFPEVPLVHDKGDNCFIIKGEALKNAFKKVSPFIKSSPSKPEAGGMFIKTLNGITEFVGCDGFHLAVVSYETNGDDCSINIPKETMRGIIPVINDDDDVAVYVGSRNMRIVINGYNFICRQYDQPYMDYDPIFNEAVNGNIINLSLTEFERAIDTATPLIEKAEKTPVILDVNKDNIQISSCSSIGKMKTRCNITSNLQKKIRIGANSTFLNDALRAMESEEIEIIIKSSTSAILIRDENCKAIVLPMRVKQE